MSDVFRNLKGTSKTEFRLGLSNRGSGLYSGSSDPSGSYTISAGDIWFDKNNQRLAIRTGGGTWTDVTNTSVVDNQITSTLSSDVSFGADVTITGNLTVNGTQSIINTETLNIADNEIVLNSDLASNQAATANAGILVNRGNEGNVFLRWDEGEGEWTVNGETFSAGALIGNLSGNVTGSIQPNGVPNVVRANTLIVNGAYTMPSSDGSANQILQTDGSGAISFADPQSTPGGANTQIQFNDAGSFNGNTSLTWNTSAERLDVKHLNVSGVFSRAVDYGGIVSSADPANTYDYGDIGEVHEGTEFIVKDDPQLGGNLDLNSNSITGTGDIDITGTGKFSGNVTLSTFSSNVNEVLVVGTAGVIDSTDNLTIDVANSRVGIGTASPSVKLDIVGEAANETQMRMAQHNDSGDAPDVRFFKSRGTEASPTAVNNGDNLAFVNSFSYDGSAYQQSGAFGWQADGTDADSKFILNTRVGGTVGTRLEVLNTGDVDIKQAVVAKSYKDTVFTITDSASVDIDPDNGGIQVWTLGASRSPTANNFDAGAKVMLMIADGASHTITWPSVNWVGGVAPTLATTGYSIIELWKVGTQLYGAFAGGVA